MIKMPPPKNSSTSSDQKALPAWVTASVLGAVLLLVALIGWHTFQAVAGPSRPDLPVHAGMYNLRQELQKGSSVQPGVGKSIR